MLAVYEDRSLPPSDYSALGATLRPASDWTITGRAYHAKQGDVNGIASVDNQPLDPERQTKFEGSISLTRWPALQPTVTVFSTQVRNLKTPVKYVSVNGVTTAFFTQSDNTMSGAEIVAQGSLVSAFGLTRYRASWTHLAHTGAIVETGRSAPPNLATFALTHQWRRWDFNVSAQYVDTFFSNWMSLDGAAHPIGDYTRIDASLGRTFPLGPATGRLSLYARNITDDHYETQLGFPDVGSVYGVELAVDL
jgi:hypothetical protein